MLRPTQRRKRALGQTQRLFLPAALLLFLRERARPQLLKLRDERVARGWREERRGAMRAGPVRRLLNAEHEAAGCAVGRVF